MSTSWPEAWQASLPLDTSERDALIAALALDAPASIRLNSRKSSILGSPPPVPWHPQGFYLPQRPRYTSDPAFHAGAYYPQEASSMFVAHIAKELGLHKEAIHALDLCAAPGGKSTLLRDLLHPESLLLANEVVGSRVNLLEENLTKCGIPGYAISQSDPSRFGKLPALFDLVLVDAPCSGEGMFRKDPQALEHWSPANVETCALRQTRILSDVWPALKPGGILIYSTCTFNLAENEEQVESLLKSGDAEGVEVISPFPEIVRSDATTTSAFRFFPHRVLGEGFFVAVLRKSGTVKAHLPKGKPLQVVKDLTPAPNLCAVTDARGNLFAARPAHLQTLSVLAQGLNLLVPGQPVGSYIQQKWKPGAGLALLVDQQYLAATADLDLREALRYLQRDDVYKDGVEKGPVLVRFEGFALGYAKAGGGRLVSQHPTHWRVRQGREEVYLQVVTRSF